MPQLIDKTTDQRLIHHGVMWEQFKLIQKGFETSPGIRLFYYNGIIEILRPGRDHEFFKTLIGLLLETFFVEKGIEFEPTGSMDQEKEGEVCVQADESYCVGTSKPCPDLLIEVIFTSGSVKKLERYHALGVPEVWFWEDELLTMHHLRSQGYERIYRSEIPELASLYSIYSLAAFCSQKRPDWKRCECSSKAFSQTFCRTAVFDKRYARMGGWGVGYILDRRVE